MNRFAHRDLIPAAALILIGAWALWDTRDMSTFGAIFPQLASGGMLIGGLALAGRAILLAPPVRIPEGELMRPLLLLALLLVWAVMLPITGFIATSIAAALVTMLLSTETRPTTRGILIESGSLIVIVLAVALLFGQVLQVQLP